jgi:AcrR family transcriptional regulator
MAYPAKTDRSAILAAAVGILAQQGLRGMSWRAVAASLGLAPNSLYRYFASRKHLEMAVAAEVAGRLHAALLKTNPEKQAAEKSIRAFAKAYLLFAREQHLLYEALLVPRPASGEDAIAPRRLWLFAVGVVSRVSGPKAAQEATVALWAFLHGIAALHSADAFDAEKPFSSSFEFGYRAWMEAARAAASAGAKARRAKPGRDRARKVKRGGSSLEDKAHNLEEER